MSNTVKISLKSLSLIVTFFAFISSASAQLEVGDSAPQFSAESDAGITWYSTDYVGSNVLVVYFYPAAMTGGCTKQACAFRDDKATFDALGAMVVGVSGDEVENLVYFKEAHQLNFPLLADPNGTIANQFGVALRDGGSIVRTVNDQEVTLERGVTASRWTFIIDKKGKIVYKNTEVNAAEDSKATLEVIKNL